VPRRSVNSGDYHVPIEGFSQMIVAGDVLYLSGLTARDGSGEIVGVGDTEAQARQILDSMRRILAEAGATLDDVVKVTTYMRDIGEWPRVQALFHEYWGDPWPASTLVEISRLFDERQLIEIEAVAQVG
jgi:2-iminobutanoate/2-iminopropanoate deaminase